ncbi:uncharacterized protein LOC119069103 [Bradysia coprophila]|uniref:uncharacterized protein LOC119069103 n=1 Tax=Bradysia coprophila TaxID=38358 RepID=UPI00187D8C47|nr:uncharacterized protein LOC119069103 [Bradysia coprophila]
MNEYFSTKQCDFIKSPGIVKLMNCGSLENLHRNANFQPKFSDGLCLAYKHILAPNATFNFRYVLSQTLPSGMRMGCILRPKMRDHIIDTPQLEADINPSSLTTNLSVQYHPIPALRLRFSAQLLPRVWLQNDRGDRKWHDNISLCAEYYARHSTSTISLYNPSPNSGRLTLTQLKSYSSRLAFGFELLTEWENHNLSVIIPAIGGRYFLRDKSIAATLSFRGIDFTFWHLINCDNQLATSFIYNRKNNRSLGTVFYQWMYDDIRVRGSIDSDGAIGVTCFSRINDLGCNAELSLLHCIPTQKFSLGLKFEFDSAFD